MSNLTASIKRSLMSVNVVRNDSLFYSFLKRNSYEILFKNLENKGKLINIMI